MSTQKLISQGAEAKIFLKDKKIIKDRIAKSYRIKKLDDSIRKSRTKREAKILQKALSKEINVPELINQDKFNIEIEYINGERLSETLNNKLEKDQFEILQKIGKQTALLHKGDIIHGDLTTSNTILQDKTNKVFIIDFGLGFISKRLEDKAVDLHLIKQALEAKHFQNHKQLFNEFLKAYKKTNKESTQILEQLQKVETRGRYKH